MKNNLLALGLFALVLPTVVLAQEQTPPPDGPQRTFQDELLDKMAGRWKLAGTVRGQSTEHLVEARWVLNHQFLQIHEKGTAAPKTAGPAYEANVMIGYDNTSERYVAHWIDIFGGRFSETLGYGTRSGDQIEFVFEYPVTARSARPSAGSPTRNNGSGRCGPRTARGSGWTSPT
jgi:hypothetical protein